MRVRALFPLFGVAHCWRLDAARTPTIARAVPKPTEARGVLTSWNVFRVRHTDPRRCVFSHSHRAHTQLDRRDVPRAPSVVGCPAPMRSCDAGARRS